jgi:hypothetical protein
MVRFSWPWNHKSRHCKPLHHNIITFQLYQNPLAFLLSLQLMPPLKAHFCLWCNFIITRSCCYCGHFCPLTVLILQEATQTKGTMSQRGCTPPLLVSILSYTPADGAILQKMFTVCRANNCKIVINLSVCLLCTVQRRKVSNRKRGKW